MPAPSPSASKYPVAELPWSYDSVLGILKSWGYSPVGDHSAAYRLNPEGFLVWEGVNHKTGEKKWFVISNPRWCARGSDDPVWPANVIVTALRAQEIYHQLGSNGVDPDAVVEVPLKKSRLKPVATKK